MIIRLTQGQTNLIVAIYIGVCLNAVTFFRLASKSVNNDLLITFLSGVSIFLVTYAFCALFSLFGKFLYKILLSFLIFSSAIASYYIIFFNVVIGHGIIVSTLTWDIDLSKESLGWLCIVWVIVSGIIPCYLLYRIKLTNTFYEWCRNGFNQLGHRTSLAVIGLLTLIVCMKSAIFLIEKNELQFNRYAASPGGVIAHSYLPTNWIAGLSSHIYQQIHERNTANQLFNPAQHFTYHANKSMDDLILVFVIGETTRWDHMGLLGYQRNTTPQLSAEKNLVALRGESCDTATKLSLRCMFVRDGAADDNDLRTVSERNVFAVLRTLGFSSELYAMQSEVWFYNSIDAQKYEIREVVAAPYIQQNKPVNDLILVDELAQALTKMKTGKHLLILHTKGSHFSYSQRHTPEFARYKPECLSINDDCTREQLVNSFDNSVLFVDQVLKSTIDQVREKNALVFYVSDHGESIEENNHFHATPKEVAPPEQFRVPFIIWASDKFLAHTENAAAFDKLKQKQASGKVARHTEIFDSLLGCMGFTSPDGGINNQLNWCH
jgi:KDO II ethanolaminephosphotransferase